MSLAVVLLALIGTQLTTTLRSIERGRVQTEREQLARAILHRIADDLKATVRYEPFDPSGMPAFTKTSTGTGGNGGGGGGGGTGGGGTGGGGTGGGNDGTGSANSNQSAGPTETYFPGIYGDQYNLQIDVGHIPRLDQYYSADGTVTEVDGTAPTATDVQTVTYFLANSPEPATFNGSSPTSTNATSSNSLPSSLGTSSDLSSGSSSSSSSSTASYRRANYVGCLDDRAGARAEIDRAISRSSSQQGNATAVLDSNSVCDCHFQKWPTSNLPTTTARNGIPRGTRRPIAACRKRYPFRL